MRYIAFLFLMLFSGCFSKTALPEYVGSRESKNLVKVIGQRFGWQTFLASGQGKVYDKQQSSKNSFDFEIRIDRHRWGLRGFALVLSKTIGGTLFEITSHRDRHLFADYTARPPGWLELDPRDQFHALGGASLKTLRRAMIYSWPPKEKLRVTEGEVTWGPWTFDHKTLAIKTYVDGDFTWSFDQWQPSETGSWKALKWRFQVGESWMEFYFDDDIEEGVEFTKWDFELDTGAIGPLKKVAH